MPLPMSVLASAIGQVLGLPLSPTHASMGGASAPTWTPAKWFLANEQGAWYDSSDFSTLFQDSAGTTSVTAVEQPVGFIVDKRLGMGLGPELMTDVGFDNGAEWIKDAGWSVSGGKAVHFNAAASYLRTSFQPVTGQWYRYRVVTGAMSAGTFVAAYAGNSGDTYTMILANTTYDFYLRGTGTVLGFALRSGTGAGTGKTVEVLSQSVKAVSGNHAFQATAASRPVLSARKNLALNSEQIDAANWSKRGAVAVTANAVAAPDGTLTGDLISGLGAAPTDDMYYNITIAPVGTSYVPSVHIKRVSTSGVVLLQNPYSGLAGGHWRINMALLSDAWERIVPGHAALTIVTPFVSGNPINGGGFQFSALSGGPLSFHLWGAQAETGTVATRYQRVNTATDYDTVGFPHYFALDRVDDHFTVAAGGGGTTGICVCAAIRAVGAGNARTIWSDRGTNTGYRLSINASNQLVLSAGNGSAHTEVVGPTVTDGTDYVVTGWHDGANLNVQLNAEAATSAAFGKATAGTAGFTIGKDNGAATGYYGDRIYEIVYRKNDTSSAGDRTSLIAYMAEQAGITL